MEEDPKAGASFGQYLRRERVLRNIPLEEIAQKTRIPLRTLQALEEDEYLLLPPQVYVQGFLRAYARHIGLDEHEVILRYEDHLRQETRGKREDKTGPWAKRRRRTLWIAVVLVGISSLFGGLLLWRHLKTESDRPVGYSPSAGEIFTSDGASMLPSKPLPQPPHP